jgi:hypothetical protein
MSTLSTLSIVPTLWVTLLLGTSCAPLYESPCLSDPSCPSATIDRAELPLTATLSVPIALQLGSPALLHQLELMNDQLSVHLDQGEVSLVLPHIFKQPGLEATVPARLEAQLFHAGPAELRIQIGNERLLLPTKLTAPPKFKQILGPNKNGTPAAWAWVGIPNRTAIHGVLLKSIGTSISSNYYQITVDPATGKHTDTNLYTNNGQCFGFTGSTMQTLVVHQHLISNTKCYWADYAITMKNIKTQTAQDSIMPIAESYIDSMTGIVPFTEPNLNLMLIFNDATKLQVIHLEASPLSYSNQIAIMLNTENRHAFAIVTLDDRKIPYVMIWDTGGVRFAVQNSMSPLKFDPVDVANPANTLIASLTDRINQVLKLCSTGNVRFVSGKVTPPENKPWNDLVVACSSGIYVIERTDADSFQVPVQAHLFDSAKYRISTQLPAFNRIDIGALGGTMGDDIVLIQDDVGKRASDRIDFYVGVE